MNRIFSKSTVAAVFVAIAVILWMFSGSFSINGSEASTSVGAGRDSSLNNQASGSERASVRVAVENSQAQTVIREVVVSARTEPNRSVEIRAETEGRVTAIYADRGAIVAAQAPIAQLDVRDRLARKAEAEALIAQHKLQYEAAEKLRGQNLMSESQIAEARARLVSSQAMLTNIELEIERTRIVAPFAAVVQERMIEIGDLARVGDTLAELVDIDPIIIVGDVSEREISNLAVGAVGTVHFDTGQILEGTVRYVSPVADAATRSFSVELSVPNADAMLRGGITAELKIATDDVRGHLLPPSLMTLDDSGAIGVKLVDDNELALFVAVEVLRSTAEGIWVTGLPEQARIISIGQGFVTDGQRVEAVSANELSSAR